MTLMRAQLQYFYGRAFQVLRLGDEAVIVGGRSAAIRVQGSTVTRRHARIYKQADRFWIEDLGGDGVWLNGTRTERCALTNRDKLQIGRLALEYFEVVTKQRAPGSLPRPSHFPEA
jgi:pSer/pThr/pTyr-binding forkhead associated (FHA) protein